MKKHQERGRLHTKERGLWRNQACRHPDPGLAACDPDRIDAGVFRPRGLLCGKVVQATQYHVLVDSPSEIANGGKIGVAGI